MYKNHKWILRVFFVSLFIITFSFELDYRDVASDGITIVSIVLAIYMTSFSSLLSSNLAEEMRKKQDKQIKRKTQLGVLRGYIILLSWRGY